MGSRGCDGKNITVNSEILCTVQHKLDDLMVVRFTDSNNKSYQGVLLDSTKRCCTNQPSFSIVFFTSKHQEHSIWCQSLSGFQPEADGRQSPRFRLRVCQPPHLLPPARPGGQNPPRHPFTQEWEASPATSQAGSLQQVLCGLQ